MDFLPLLTQKKFLVSSFVKFYFGLRLQNSRFWKINHTSSCRQACRLSYKRVLPFMYLVLTCFWNFFWTGTREPRPGHLCCIKLQFSEAAAYPLPPRFHGCPLMKIDAYRKALWPHLQKTTISAIHNSCFSAYTI